MKYFSSDWHLSHTNVIKFSQRPFRTVQEMNDTIINNILKVLKKDDEFYFLGDFSWSYEVGLEFFKRFQSTGAKFYWILGNHEKGYQRYKTFCEQITQFKEINIQGNSVTLCHYPMITWNKSHYNSWQLFGHHHANENGGVSRIDKKIEGKMLNVNCEFNDYKPWSENDIVAYMNKRTDNWDLIKK